MDMYDNCDIKYVLYNEYILHKAKHKSHYGYTVQPPQSGKFLTKILIKIMKIFFQIKNYTILT